MQNKRWKLWFLNDSLNAFLKDWSESSNDLQMAIPRPLFRKANKVFEFRWQVCFPVSKIS